MGEMPTQEVNQSNSSALIFPICHISSNPTNCLTHFFHFQIIEKCFRAKPLTTPTERPTKPTHSTAWNPTKV